DRTAQRRGGARAARGDGEAAADGRYEEVELKRIAIRRTSLAELGVVGLEELAHVEREAAFGDHAAAGEQLRDVAGKEVIARPGIEFLAVGVGDFQAKAVDQVEAGTGITPGRAFDGDPAGVIG